MSELTKEYFETHLDSKLGGLATQQDLNDQIKGLEGKMKGRISNEVNALEEKLLKAMDLGFEKLTRMVNFGFTEVKWRLDVSEKVHRLEVEMAKIKGTINLK